MSATPAVGLGEQSLERATSGLRARLANKAPGSPFSPARPAPVLWCVSAKLKDVSGWS
jgi:hypothetical protein